MLQTNSRSSYDTAVKHLYRKGLESAIPNHLRSSIPRTNVFRWRNELDSKYLGHDLNNIAGSELALLQSFATSKTAKQVFLAWCRIAITVKTILASLPQVQSILRKQKASIVTTIETVASTISKKQILKMLNISRGTYQSWKAHVLLPCAASAFSSCLKIWPQQTTNKEVNTISNMLQDPAYAAWPPESFRVRSIAWHAIRIGKLSLSVQTWYKYARLIGLTRKMIKKPRKSKSVRATKSNQIWHADVTLIRTRDGIRHYCYLVVDNFSRKVLSYHVSTVLSANLRVQTLREAAMPLLQAEHSNSIDLIVDGGSENNNATVESFISDCRISIHKLIALRDVHFSKPIAIGSMVEAVNKVLKYRYLFPKVLPDSASLFKAVEDAITDYNEIRPHGSLNGLTPSEAYQGIECDSLRTSEKLKQAQIARIQANRKARCKGCES